MHWSVPKPGQAAALLSRRALIVLLLLLTVVSAAGIVGVLQSSTFNSEKRKQSYLRSGLDYVARGKLREASIQFLNAIQIDPRWAEPHYQLAKVALRLSDYGTARLEFEQVVQLAPENLDAHAQWGYLLLDEGKVIEARDQADLVLAKQPKNADAILLKAEVHSELQEPDLALQEARQAIALAPDNARAYVTESAILIQTKKYPEAEAGLRKILQREPNNLQALLSLGTLLGQLKRFPEAESAIQAAVKAAPENASPRSALMQLYLDENRRDEAKKVAEQAKTDLPDNTSAYRMLADYYVKIGDLDQAITEFGVVGKEHRTDWAIRKTHVQLLLISNRLDEAEKLNNELAASLGDDADVLIERAQIQLKQEKPDQAVVSLKSALRVTPDNYLAHLVLGMAMDQTGDFSGAEREYQEAARLQPLMTKPHVLLAELANRRSDAELFKKETEWVLRVDPASATGYLLRARAELGRRELDNAESDANKGTSLEPNNPSGPATLAQIKLARGATAEGERLLNHALELDGDYVPALTTLTGLYVRAGHRDQAIQRVQEQIQKRPANSEYQHILGELYWENKDYASANAALEKSVQLDTHNDPAWQLLGQVQAAQGSLDRTVETYRRWMAISATNPRPYVYLGQIYASRGDWQSAQNFYRQALSADSGNPPAANNLAYSILEHGGDLDSAMSYVMIARRGDPNSPIIGDTLGWAYYHKNQYKLAASVLEPVALALPDDASVQYHLGLSYQKLKQWDRARVSLSRSLELDPKFDHADDVRRALQQVQVQSTGDDALDARKGS